MGHIECCGVTVPVTGIHLERGMLVFTARRYGPVRAVAGMASVFGPDGVEFARGAILATPAVRRREVLEWRVECSFPEGPEGCRPVIAGEVLDPGPLALDTPDPEAIAARPLSLARRGPASPSLPAEPC
jgi:hypothetical protein